MLACQWLDVVFVVLFAAGIEGMMPVAGASPGAYGGAIIHADYSHSLVGAAILSFLFAAISGLRYGRRSGSILGLVAFSHWILDLPMHRRDIPIMLGGGLARLGFGLWRHPAASAIVELVLVLVGTLLYSRAARRVATGDARMIRRARVCSAAVLGAGLLTLALNVSGM